MGAVNLVHSGRVAEVAAGRMTAREVAEQYAGYSKPCAGDCGNNVLAVEMFRELSKRAQRILSEMNVRVAHDLQACKLCVVQVRKQNTPQKKTHAEKAEEKRAEVTALWERIRSEGGSRKELALALGVTRQAVDYLIRKYSIEVEHTAKERARIFQEELTFFLSCGLGVHEIAQRLGVTPEFLVRKVDSLRGKGQTAVNFDSYKLGEAA